MSIVCIAVIGQQNNPLYLRTFTPVPDDQHLKYHYIVHCSLDAVEEKVLAKRSPAEAADPYLGLLYPTQEHRVFGFVTNSHVKFILVLEESTPKDDQVNKVFRRLHAAYVDTTSNPFHTFGMPIRSAKFESAVEAAVTSFGRGPMSSASSLQGMG